MHRIVRALAAILLLPVIVAGAGLANELARSR